MKVLVVGAPGVGKSTVARGLLSCLRAAEVATSGFVTREVRQAGRRVGFEVEATTGARAMLASVDFSGPTRVGRYGVDVRAFERVALPALQQPARVVLIDEIGAMELASTAFRHAVQSLFHADRAIVATAHIRPDPVTDQLKARDDVDLVTVTAGNRDTLPGHLSDLVRSHLS